ncbi:hypothetical protein ACVWXS_003866 [Lysinibacillus sp. TE18511]
MVMKRNLNELNNKTSLHLQYEELVNTIITGSFNFAWIIVSHVRARINEPTLYTRRLQQYKRIAVKKSI